jgi:hypothetical protein
MVVPLLLVRGGKNNSGEILRFASGLAGLGSVT